MRTDVTKKCSHKIQKWSIGKRGYCGRLTSSISSAKKF